MKSLDFRNTKKEYMKITMPDGTELLVGTPTKKIFEEFIGIKELFDGDSTESLDTIYDVTAKVLSHNKAKMQISKEYLENTLDIDDLIVFYTSYLDYVSELANQKN